MTESSAARMLARLHREAAEQQERMLEADDVPAFPAVVRIELDAIWNALADLAKRVDHQSRP